MASSVGDGDLLTRIPTIDDVLNAHLTALRDDFVGYRNHVYRVVNLCVAIAGRSEVEKIAISAAFHDLGIWANRTFDYIKPADSSVQGACRDGSDCDLEKTSRVCVGQVHCTESGTNAPKR